MQQHEYQRGDIVIFNRSPHLVVHAGEPLIATQLPRDAPSTWVPRMRQIDTNSRLRHTGTRLRFKGRITPATMVAAELAALKKSIKQGMEVVEVSNGCPTKTVHLKMDDAREALFEMRFVGDIPEVMRNAGFTIARRGWSGHPLYFRTN